MWAELKSLIVTSASGSIALLDQKRVRGADRTRILTNNDPLKQADMGRTGLSRRHGCIRLDVLFEKSVFLLFLDDPRSLFRSEARSKCACVCVLILRVHLSRNKKFFLLPEITKYPIVRFWENMYFVEEYDQKSLSC